MIDPEPTTRAMIDVGRKCNVNCMFCYYKHLGDLTKQEFTNVEIIYNDIDSAKSRGNDYIDITGGEPTIHPQITDIVNYINNSKMKCCIITNAIAGKNTLQSIIDAGVDQFLISIHGDSSTQDVIMGIEGARKRQNNFIDQLNDNKVSYRFNCVLNSLNHGHIEKISEYCIQKKPTIVNFINMNPHGDWQTDKKRTQDVIADLRIVEPKLNNAICKLEDNGIGVNVRYYPMCRIHEKYRRCICNDLHVMFDPYEWDYSITPKTFKRYLKWGYDTSFTIENKNNKCNACDLQYVCGGINKHFNLATNGDMIDSVIDDSINKYDFYAYRKYNTITLTKRA